MPNEDPACDADRADGGRCRGLPLKRVTRELVRRGHAIDVLTEEAAQGDEDSWTIRANLGRAQQFGTRPELSARLKSTRPDVVFSHQVRRLDLEQTLLESGPVILFVHTFQGMCVSGRKMHAWPVPRPCSRPLGVGCLGLYLPRRCGGLNPLTALRLYEEQVLRRQLMKRYQRLIVASKYMATQVAEAGVESARTSVIPFFSNLADQVPARRPLRPTGTPLRLLYMGRLTDDKGCLLLPAALSWARERIDREVELIVAGEGPEREALERKCEAALVKCNLLGWLDEQAKVKILETVDLLVIPSVLPEPFGLVGIEAAAMCVPAVGFDSGGISEWLENGESGELARSEPPTSRSLGEAIARAAVDPDRLLRLGMRARVLSKRFSAFVHVRELEIILNADVADEPP